MSSTVVTCPKCSTQYNLSNPKLDGKQVKCRNCQTPFVVKMSGGGAASGKGNGGGSDAGTGAPPGRGTKQTHGGEKPAVKGRGQPEADAGSGSEEDAGAATKRRKNRMIVAVVVSAVLLLGAGGYGVVRLMGGGGASAIEVPQNFVDYNQPDCAVTFEYPAGWKVTHKAGDGGKPAWARIEMGKMSIQIKDSLKSGAIGDMAGSAGGDGMGIKELEPVHQVHEFNLELLKIEESRYVETNLEVFQTRMGEARLAEYKRPGNCGYRATLPPGVRAFTVTVKAGNQANFAKFKETFRRIIASINHGAG